MRDSNIKYLDAMKFAAPQVIEWWARFFLKAMKKKNDNK